MQIFHFRSFLCSFIDFDYFWSILVLFGEFGKIEIQYSGLKMAAFSERDVILTPNDVIRSFCRPQGEQFWRYFLPSKLV